MVTRFSSPLLKMKTWPLAVMNTSFSYAGQAKTFVRSSMSCGSV